MKKSIIFLLLIIIFLCGCNHVSKEKNIYLDYIKELEKVSKSDEDIPFDIEVRYDKLIKSEVRYEVILDNVKENISNISMIAVHNRKTDDVYPSIGIFDKKESLKVNEKPSGLILVGYVDYKGDIKNFKMKTKVLIKYKINNKEYTKHYVTK